MMQRAVFVLCLLIWGCGCGRVRENAEVRDAIIRNNANAVRWDAEGNADALANMCAVDAWQMPPNHAPLVGREAIREFWRQALRWGKWEFAFDTQHVDVNGPLAVERGKYVLRFTAGPMSRREWLHSRIVEITWFTGGLKRMGSGGPWGMHP
jgi:ketosteroid isomerase-like protein